MTEPRMNVAPGAGNQSSILEANNELKKVTDALYGSLHKTVDESKLPANIKTEMLIDLAQDIDTVSRKYTVEKGTAEFMAVKEAHEGRIREYLQNGPTYTAFANAMSKIHEDTKKTVIAAQLPGDISLPLSMELSSVIEKVRQKYFNLSRAQS